jgi:hypothetical protein
MLLRLYPRRWRLRYGEELDAVIDQASLDLPALLDLAGAAARQRLRALLPPLLAGVATFGAASVALVLLQLEALMIAQVAASAAGHPLAFTAQVGPVLFWSTRPVHSPELFSGGWGAGAIGLTLLGAAVAAAVAAVRQARRTAAAAAQ